MYLYNDCLNSDRHRHHHSSRNTVAEITLSVRMRHDFTIWYSVNLMFDARDILLSSHLVSCGRHRYCNAHNSSVLLLAGIRHSASISHCG